MFGQRGLKLWQEGRCHVGHIAANRLGFIDEGEPLRVFLELLRIHEGVGDLNEVGGASNCHELELGSLQVFLEFRQMVFQLSLDGLHFVSRFVKVIIYPRERNNFLVSSTHKNYNNKTTNKIKITTFK